MYRHRGAKLRTQALPYDVQKAIVGKEEQQEWSPSLDQWNPNLPHMKEEQGELWTGREGEPVEADIKFTFTPVPVKSERQEGKLQPSQLHQRQTEQMKTAADGDDHRAADRNSYPDRLLKSVILYKTSKMSVAEIEVNCDWEEPIESQSGLNSMGKNGNTTRHSPDKPFRCPECGKRFANKGYLKTHMRIHTGEKPFGCSVCGKKYTKQIYLTKHMPVHRLEKRHSCGVCNKRFALHSGLECHRCIGSPESVILVSSESETGDKTDSSKTSGSVTDWSKTWDHKSPSDKAEYNSWNCGKDSFVSKEFAHRRSLARHMLNHTGENLLRCPECDKTFVTWSRFVMHMRSHTAEKPFRCFCGKAFAQSSHLTGHMRCHMGERPYACPVCKRAFSQSSHLKSHMRTCGRPKAARKPQAVSDEDTSESSSNEETTSDSTGTDEETSDSSETDETSDSSKTDEETTDSSKTDEETSDSSKTDEETSTSSETDETSDSSETDEFDKDWNKTREPASALKKTKSNSNSLNSAKKAFSCSECGKEYSHRRSVTRHMIVHKGEKPFSCSVCSKAFHQKLHLQRHMPVHEEEILFNHPIDDEKAFFCPECGTKVAHNRNVKRHLMLHVKNSFTCPICKSCFSQRSHLNT